MKYIFAFLLTLAGLQLWAQSYDLQFVTVQHDATTGGHYDVKIQIKKAIGNDFSIGSSNIRFHFNAAGLSLKNPALQEAHHFDAANSAAYLPMTTQGSKAGFVSVNIDLENTNAGQPTISSSSWTDVATIGFIIEDTNQTSNLEFSTATPGNTVIFADDQSTLLTAATLTPKDEPLGSGGAPLTISIVSQSDVSCNGFLDGSATASASGGNGSYTYNWSNGALGAVANGLIAGTYAVTVNDGSTTASTTVTISQPDLLEVLVNGTAATMGNNGTAMATASGGTTPYSYLWNTGATTSLLTGLAPGIYTVTVTDTNQCTATGSYTVQDQNSVCDVSVVVSGTAATMGNNGTAMATASGGTTPYSYLWNTGATTSLLTGLAPGIYTVTVTDTNQCTATGSYTVQDQNSVCDVSVVVSGTAATMGNNGTAMATASGGTTPYSYLWNTGATTSQLIGLAPGTYTITVTDMNQCTTTGSYTVQDNNGGGGCTTVVVEDNDFESGWGIWNDGGIDCQRSYRDNSFANTGNYCVRLQDNSSSSNMYTDNLDLSTYDEVTIDFNFITDGFSANIHELLLEYSTNGGLNYTIAEEWNFGDEITDGIRVFDAVTIVGPFTNTTQFRFRANAETNNNKVYLDDVFISGCEGAGNNSLSLSISSQSDVNCFGQADGAATVQATGGSGMYSYFWNNGAVGASATNLSAGTYSVTVDDGMLTAATTVTISEPSVLIVNISSTNADAGNNGTATATVAGGTPPYIYLWSNGATAFMVSNLSQGTYNLTVTDANNCTTEESVTITDGSGGTGCTMVVVEDNDFESGWGIWNDGGIDCQRSYRDNSFANTGNYCVRLRDNSNTSNMYTDNLDLTTYDEITIDFNFITNNYSSVMHSLYLEYSTDGGASFIGAKAWNYTDEFINGVRVFDAVTIAGPFSGNTQFRFRANADNDNNQVFIDDVFIEGCSNSTGTSLMGVPDNTSAYQWKPADFSKGEGWRLFPNPASEEVRLSVPNAFIGQNLHIRIIDWNGQLIRELKVEAANQQMLRLNALPAGVYVIQAFTETEQWGSRLTVIR